MRDFGVPYDSFVNHSLGGLQCRKIFLGRSICGFLDLDLRDTSYETILTVRNKLLGV